MGKMIIMVDTDRDQVEKLADVEITDRIGKRVVTDYLYSVILMPHIGDECSDNAV